MNPILYPLVRRSRVPFKNFITEIGRPIWTAIRDGSVDRACQMLALHPRLDAQEWSCFLYPMIRAESLCGLQLCFQHVQADYYDLDDAFHRSSDVFSMVARNTHPSCRDPSVLFPHDDPIRLETVFDIWKIPVRFNHLLDSLDMQSPKCFRYLLNKYTCMGDQEDILRTRLSALKWKGIL
jgi:hypothetical protein